VLGEITGNNDQDKMSAEDLEKLKIYKQTVDQSTLSDLEKSNQGTCSICLKEYALEEEI